MKMNIKIALVALLCAGAQAASLAQEDAPVNNVRDGMEESRTPSSEIPDTAPRVSDIDRLFGDSARNDSVVNDEDSTENGMISVSDSMASQLDQGGMSLDSSDLISVDYPNEEIRTVLRNVADLYNLNIVVPDTLQGTTSIKLRDVTWRQIFSVVLDPVGYTYVEEGSIIKIVSKDALNIEPPVTEIFMINYADAEVISNTIKNLVDATNGGKVQVDKRSNALIVSERASKMESIRNVIERLDRATQQVMIETRFIEVSNNDAKNIGVNWSTLRNYGVGVGDIARGWSETFDRDKITDPRTGQTLSVVDRSTISKATSAVFSAEQFVVLLNALQDQGGSRLVSNPTVVTLNNLEAMIHVGETYPIPRYTYNEERGTFEVAGFDDKNIGITLRVTPSVNNAGLITLKVTPEVSTLAGISNFNGAEIPIVSSRETSTQIALKDGYTMGIGGLMQSQDTNSQSSVPGLGKIPGVGRLFRNNSKTNSKTNLLIFITAKILPGEEATFEDVFSQEMMQDTGVDPVMLKNR